MPIFKKDRSQINNQTLHQPQGEKQAKPKVAGWK